MAFELDQYAALMAQKLATTLLIDPLTSGRMPYMIVKAASSYSNKKSADEGANDILNWTGDFFSKSDEELENKLTATTVAFDVVSDYSVSYSGSLRQRKMLSGDTVADSFTKENPSYQLTAKISRTSTLGNHSVAATVAILKDAFAMGLPVYVYLPDLTSISKYNEGITETIEEGGSIFGFITNLNVSRDASIQDGFNLSITVAQPMFAETLLASGIVEVVPVDKDLESNTSPEEKAASARQTFKGLCGEQVSLAYQRFDKTDQTGLLPPEELKSDLEDYIGFKGVTEKNCPVDDIMKDYLLDWTDHGKK